MRTTLFLFGFAILSLSAAASGTTPGEGFDVISYQLALTPDSASKTLSGRETIILRVTGDRVERLCFSGNALTVTRARLDGDEVSVVLRGETLDFDLPRPVARGRILRLQISYHGRPKRGFVATPTSLYTSYFACDWMVCPQNQFGDKAAFTLDLSVPAGMETLSVGERITKRPGLDGREIHRWKSQRPYSAYLFGFAVGRFKRVEVGPLALFSDVADVEDLKRRFLGTAEMIDFMAGKAGMQLPVVSYGQLLVSGDEAQEAATYSVLGIDALPSKPNDPEEDWAIAHELAHQWWGNLITCQTLKDFWLNEGITTFMTAAWKEHRYGRNAYDAELGLARRRVETAHAAGYDKPLAWGGKYPDIGTRRTIQYSKGALFMDRLRTVLGEDAFWSGLRSYTRKHSGGTVTSIDLQRAMEKASGQDLGQLFTEWVFGAEREISPAA